MSQERLSFATIGRHLRDDLAAAQEVDLVEALEQLARLRVPEPDAVADAQPARTEQRRLHLARALGAIELQTRGEPRARKPVAPGRPRGWIAAAQHGDHPRPRDAH